jgi:sulfopyruvate decarboxylase TPP-binding subunit
MMSTKAAAGPSWHEIVCDTLKRNSVRLVTYVPDNVLKPLINALHADDDFTTFATTREEQARSIKQAVVTRSPAHIALN